MAITKDAENVVTIKVIGIGGAGNNVVNRMAAGDTKGVEFIAVNTDKQALAVSGAKQTIQIGEKLTHGQGAGSDPDVGKRAAEESRNAIAEALEGTDMVFLTAGMGGGTGTGAAPVVAEAAKDAGILTVGVVTRPFSWEGRRRALQAQQGGSELMGRVDSLLIIPNDRLKYASPEKVTLANAFEIADDVLIKAVSSISELIKNTGFINLDFADVTAVMKGAGLAHMGVGRAAGKNKAEDAAKMAVSSPLMETSIDGARGVLINITGSKEMGLDDVEAAAMLVQGAAHPEANIIFGASFDDSLDDEIVVTVIATGFDEKKPETVKIEEPRDANLFTDARERAEIFYVLAALDASEQMYARTDIPERGPARVLSPDDAGEIVASPVEPVDREHQIADLPSHRRSAAVRAFAERARQFDLVDPYGRFRRRQLTGEHTDNELAALAAVVVERAHLARNTDEPRA